MPRCFASNRCLGLCRVTCMLVAVTIFASPAQAVERDRASGKADLQKAQAFENKKIQHVELKAGPVKVTAKLRIDEFFKKTFISANVVVQNTGEKAMFYQYFVAFFDDDGNLLGAGGQGSFGNKGLAGGKKANLSGVQIHMSQAQLKNVSRYQIVIYADTKPIGQSHTKSKKANKK